MLVTGASGLLGGNFAVAASRDFQVSACYGRHALSWEGIDGFSVDLRRPEETAALLLRTRPAIIAHFAALTNVDQCEEEPEVAEEVNVGISERLARWAAANNARFLLMSTDSVFDGISGGYTESDQPNPLNRYAATKLAAEKVVRDAGGNHLIVRANIYGWNAQAKSSLAEWVLGRLEMRQQVPGFTDVAFAPLLVNTLADIMLAMLGRGARGLYHVASDRALSKYEFALAVAGVFGFPSESIVPTVLGTALKAPRPRNTALDASRVHRELGVVLPAVVGDVRRFRWLRDTGYVDRLKAACLNTQ